MKRYDLTPRSRMQLLDGAFTLFQQHMSRLVAIASVFFSLDVLCRFGLARAMLGRWDAPGLLQAGPLAISLVMAINTFFGCFSAAALVWAVSEILMGRQPQTRAAARMALRRGWAVLAFSALFTLASCVGAILLIVPGVLVLLNWALATQAIMVENMPVTRAIRRSKSLAQGHRATVAALGLAGLVLTAVFNVGCSQLLSRLLSGAPFLAALLGEVPGLLLAPLFPCLMTLLYYDLRSRKEAYDLELELEATRGAASREPVTP